ncbi:MAG: cupin domain-containing protein [Acidobacteriaceae bacterium]|nr:cupin domain-containing protein [Acidobacteriaceae bacterium]
MISKVNLHDAFRKFDEYYDPKIAGQINDMYLKLVKFRGEFTWHHHKNEDELFLVNKGKFTMKLRTGDIEVCENEFIIVPRGVEHCPYAENECSVILLEPKTTLNTGNVRNELTRTSLETLGSK